jgi:hypothetical protein
LAGAFEASYERNLNKDSSVGISFFIPYDDENLDSDLNYYISPYYRLYFGKKYAAGFFLEGFAMVNSYDEYRGFEFFINGVSQIENNKSYTDVALGFGLGGKWITRKGITFEVSGGFGRNLLNQDKTDVTFVGKFALNIGYRF